MGEEGRQSFDKLRTSGVGEFASTFLRLVAKVKRWIGIGADLVLAIHP